MIIVDDFLRIAQDIMPTIAYGIRVASAPVRIGLASLRLKNNLSEVNGSLRNKFKHMKKEAIKAHPTLRKVNSVASQTLFEKAWAFIRAESARFAQALSGVTGAIAGITAVTKEIQGHTQAAAHLFAVQNVCFFISTPLIIYRSVKQCRKAYRALREAQDYGDLNKALKLQQEVQKQIVTVVGEVISFVGYTAMVCTTGVPPQLWMTALTLAGTAVSVLADVVKNKAIKEIKARAKHSSVLAREAARERTREKLLYSLAV